MTEPTITFRLPQPMKDWVEKTASKQDRSVASVLRMGILRLMPDDDVRKLDRPQHSRAKRG